jgi:hypothetical protein
MKYSMAQKVIIILIMVVVITILVIKLSKNKSKALSIKQEIDKSTLRELIDTHSSINTVKYSRNIPYMKVESIGIPLKFSYIPVSYIEHILTETSDNIEDRMFELVSTSEKVTLDYDTTGVLLYRLKKIKIAGNIILTISTTSFTNSTPTIATFSFFTFSLTTFSFFTFSFFTFSFTTSTILHNRQMLPHMCHTSL